MINENLERMLFKSNQTETIFLQKNSSLGLTKQISNPQFRMAETQSKSILASSQINSSLIPVDFPLSPDQRQIYYKIYYLKHSFEALKLEPDFRTSIIAEKLSTDSAFVEVLKQKSDKLKENLKKQAEIFQCLIFCYERLSKKLNSYPEELLLQKQKLIYMSNIIVHRRQLEENLAFEITYLRRKIENFTDDIKEAEGYMLVFATCDPENKTKIAEASEFVTVKSLVMKTYDLFQGEIKRLEMAFQDFLQYFNIDKESVSFKLKIQALIAVLTENTEFANQGYLELVKLSRMVCSCLRQYIDAHLKILEEYRKFYENIEESYLLVQKIIYIRTEKIEGLLEEFLMRRNNVFSSVGPFYETSSRISVNYLTLRSIARGFKGFRVVLKGLKQDIRILRDDNTNLFFVNIRLIQSKKTLKCLKIFGNDVKTGLFLVGYLEHCLEKEVQYGFSLINDSKTNGISRMEARIIQARIKLFQNRLREILNIDCLKPIHYIPRKLLDVLERRFESLQTGQFIEKEEKNLEEKTTKTDAKIKDFDSKTQEKTQEDLDYEKKIRNFEKKYAAFLLRPFKSRNVCLSLQKEARNLQFEKQNNAKEKESLQKKDTVLGISNDFFFDLENLRIKWLEDTDFRESTLEQEKIVQKDAEKIETFLDKKPENDRFIRFVSEILSFISDFQKIKKTEDQKDLSRNEQVSKFLREKRGDFQGNEFLTDTINGLLRIKLPSNELQKPLKKEQDRKLEDTKNIEKNRSKMEKNPLLLEVKSQEFKQTLKNKSKTPTLRKNKGDMFENPSENQDFAEESEKASIFNEEFLENKTDLRGINVKSPIKNEKKGNFITEKNQNKKPGIENLGLPKKEVLKEDPDQAKSAVVPLSKSKATNRNSNEKKQNNLENNDKSKENNDQSKENNGKSKETPLKIPLNENENDSSDSDIFGWDTYYISNTLNSMFGIKKRIDIPMKTPRKKEI